MILSRSLDGNCLTYGEDMSAVLKLAEVLPQTKIQTLRCLSAKCGRSLLAPLVTRVPLGRRVRTHETPPHERRLRV